MLKDGIIGTERMDALQSGQIVIWSVVGGLGTLVGPFIGAGFVGYVTNYLTNYTDRYILIVGLIFVVTILLAPKGIVGSMIEQWRSTEGDDES